MQYNVEISNSRPMKRDKERIDSLLIPEKCKGNIKIIGITIKRKLKTNSGTKYFLAFSLKSLIDKLFPKLFSHNKESDPVAIYNKKREINKKIRSMIGLSVKASIRDLLRRVSSFFEKITAKTVSKRFSLVKNRANLTSSNPLLINPIPE